MLRNWLWPPNWLSSSSKLRCMVTKMPNQMLIAPFNWSNTVLYWKKAWSYFIINKIMAWNEIAMTRNPTRSRSMLDLIMATKKMEAAWLGVPSQARWEFQAEEFGQVLQLLTTQSGESGIWLAAYVAFQLSMIARIDNTAKFRAPNLQPLHAFPDYGITPRLCWSKNCREECNVTTQVLFGADNWRCCVLAYPTCSMA